MLPTPPPAAAADCVVGSSLWVACSLPGLGRSPSSSRRRAGAENRRVWIRALPSRTVDATTGRATASENPANGGATFHVIEASRVRTAGAHVDETRLGRSASRVRSLMTGYSARDGPSSTRGLKESGRLYGKQTSTGQPGQSEAGRPDVDRAALELLPPDLPACSSAVRGGAAVPRW